MAKILIVDDSEMMRESIKKTLRLGGHKFITAEDGLDGLQKLQNDIDVDLILCDVNMPEMDGMTMVSKLTCDTPVIMITTENSISMKATGKKHGVIAWATKPFNSVKLLNAINKIIKRKIRSKR